MIQRYLILHPNTPREHAIPLTLPAYRIGRDPQADIRIDERSISGLHCSLVMEEHCATLMDLGSTNGSFVNGERITSMPLHNGDKIILGKQHIDYRELTSMTPTSGHTTSLYHLPESVCNNSMVHLAPTPSTSPDAADLPYQLELAERNNRLLETLYTMLEKIFSVGDRDAAFTILLGELSSLLQLELASIYLTDENRFGILEGKGLEWSDEYPVVSRSVLNGVLANKQTMIIDTVDEADSSMRTLLKFKIQAVLCFPVLRRDASIAGVVYCVSRSAGHLELLKNDTHFITVCSGFIALVLENLQAIERQKQDAYEYARAFEERRFVPIVNRLQQEKENLTLKYAPQHDSETFFGLDESDAGTLRQFIEKAAPTRLPVLITGETGVGKSLFAKTLHAATREKAPFVVIDCTTIPHELLESELFGHEKGAFTGAHAKKAGKIAGANDGTLFIDEIGELGHALQAKLLRFIQTGMYEPLGSTVTQQSTARIIAATNRDLRGEVAERRFREDLYYRLHVLTIELPPLRSRKATIVRLANHFLEKYRLQLNPKVKSFTKEAAEQLSAYAWPGNIRELENTVMRALVNATATTIDSEHCALTGIALPAHSESPPGGDNDSLDLKAARERIDRILIAKALDTTGRNVSRAADVLSISRNSLMDLMKKYGL